MLGLPEDVCDGLAFIGKPGETGAEPRLKERHRPLEALIHWQRW